MLVLAGLSTGHKIGLGVVGLVFIVFALASSFLAPRRNPDFPGKHGMSVYVIACLALFGAMVASVMVFGRESEAKAGEKTAAAAPAAAGSIQVQEKEYAIAAPSSHAAGKATFVVRNVGKIAHDLAIQGPGIQGVAGTPLIQPGKSAQLTVTLAKGTYTLFCAVPGHRSLGMVARLNVG